MERDWGFGGLWHGLQSRSAIHNPGCAISRKIYGKRPTSVSYSCKSCHWRLMSLPDRQPSPGDQPSNRCTEARLMLNRLAIADWLRPAAESARTSPAREATVEGRPCGFPRLRACAMPAFTRSRRMSRSNSAKIASSPAIARPAGVVKSKVSLSTTTRVYSRWVTNAMRRLRCERYAAWFLCW